MEQIVQVGPDVAWWYLGRNDDIVGADTLPGRQPIDHPSLAFPSDFEPEPTVDIEFHLALRWSREQFV